MESKRATSVGEKKKTVGPAEKGKEKEDVWQWQIPRPLLSNSSVECIVATC